MIGDSNQKVNFESNRVIIYKHELVEIKFYLKNGLRIKHFLWKSKLLNSNTRFYKYNFEITSQVEPNWQLLEKNGFLSLIRNWFQMKLNWNLKRFS